MALYALENLDDALDLTRAFLTPVDRTRWAKLALVTFFVGGTGASFNGTGPGVGGDGGGPGGPVFPDLGPRAWLLIAAVVGVVLVLALAFLLVGSVFEFVFVESLRRESVEIRGYWRRRWRQGVRLFGFRLLLGALTLGTALVVATPVLLRLVGAPGVGEGLGVAFLLLLLPVVLVLAVVAGLVNGFTTVFVVPVMILEDCGVLDAWRRLWPTVTSQWKQYLAYAVAGFFLSLLGGLLVGVVAAVGALVLLVPFGLLFALGVGLLAFVAEALGVAVLVAAGGLFGLAVLAVVALARVPVQTYLRYYALLVLGDVDPALDLVPDQRAAVRDSPPGSSDATGDA